MLRFPTLRLALLAALALNGCGGEDAHFAPLEESDVSPAAGPSRPESNPRSGESEGFLEVSAAGAVTSYLSGLQGVVTNVAGKVVAGGESESGSEAPSTPGAPQLRLAIPEGDEYTLTVTASTGDSTPTTCRAEVGPLRVEAGAVASVRVLAWDCGGPMGYVPSSVANDCFWLAEWLFVARTRAAVGQDIQVSAAGHDAQGNLARFDWSAPTPSLGRFAEPNARRTTFRCQSAGAAQPLTVAISGDECRAEVSQNVACE